MDTNSSSYLKALRLLKAAHDSKEAKEATKAAKRLRGPKDTDARTYFLTISFELSFLKSLFLLQPLLALLRMLITCSPAIAVALRRSRSISSFFHVALSARLANAMLSFFRSPISNLTLLLPLARIRARARIRRGIRLLVSQCHRRRRGFYLLGVVNEALELALPSPGKF